MSSLFSTLILNSATVVCIAVSSETCCFEVCCSVVFAYSTHGNCFILQMNMITRNVPKRLKLMKG